MRPVGGVFLGWIGDKYGRKVALEQSAFLMAIPTYLMGCLPTYSMIGNSAWVVLLLVRLLQGLSVGGQKMISLAYTLENQPRHRWGLCGSFIYMAANCGSLLGSMTSAILRSVLEYDDLLDYGWRLPFYAGITSAFLGIYLRYKCPNEMGHKPPENPLDGAFGPDNYLRLISLFLVSLLVSAGYYLTFVWLSIFMEDLISPAVDDAYWINSACLLVATVFTMPYAGWLSDKYGRTNIMVVGSILFGTISPVVIYFLSIGDTSIAWIGQFAISTSFCIFASPALAWMVELFPPAVRVTSMTFSYNIAAIFGGFASAFATYLADSFGLTVPGYFFSFLSICSLVGIFATPPYDELSLENGQAIKGS
mmetsp:Transcript_30230/g.42842  ORF Transcript_30230/g.42842 Transcript_30230/m.42842 type:complete len:364 (+) Transcript_30230:161-1252(+)